MSNHVVSEEELSKLWRFADKGMPHGLSYGTVRDYCEGFDLYPQLVTYSNDLKDLQRFWMLKAIIATQPKGATLVEIGAGEPLVADLLGRLGYRVIVVDPYEGAGNGPTTADHFKGMYTNVEYVIDWFSPRLAGVRPSSIDCLYSISVVEHIPLDVIGVVVEGMKLFAKPGATSLHAIDFVAGGAGDVYHHQMLRSFATLLGLSSRAVDDMLVAAASDSDTYYLSAEAHNRWRGTVPYDEFPMRRVLSAQIMSTL